MSATEQKQPPSMDSQWTRIEIDVESFSGPGTSQLLESSGTLPIELTISTPVLCTIEAQAERETVQEILSLVSPHIARCRKLEFSVIHSSSLPGITTDLHNLPSTLIALSLRAAVGDKTSGLNPGSTPNNKLQLPSLEVLEVDGWNFMQLLLLKPIQWFNDRRGRRISVSHYHLPPLLSLQSGIPILAMFPLLTKFDEVHLSNLEVIVPRGFQTLRVYPIQSLHLMKLASNVVSCLLDTLWPKELYISACDLSCVDGLPNNVTFDNMDLTHAPVLKDLIASSWHGTSLTFIDCPGLNDDLLSILGRSDGVVGPVYALKLKSLHISGCSGFSFALLREVVDLRQPENDEHSPFYFSIDEGPPMSDDDAEWLRRRQETRRDA